MADVESIYQKLIAEVKQIALLGSCASVLGWDKQTYMPKGGAGHRAEQLALLMGMIHERATAPQIGDWLGEIENSDLVSDPHSEAAVNIRELRRDYDRAIKLPRSLVEELARVATISQQAWREAREKIGLCPVSTPPQKNPRPETSTSPRIEHGRNILRHAIRRL